MYKFVNQVTAPLTRKLLLTDLQVSHLDAHGNGVVAIFARHENRAFTFAEPRLLPGEKISLLVSDLKVFQRKDKKHIRIPEFKLVQSNSPSPHEIPASCPHFASCNGCDLQHLQSEQLRLQFEMLTSDKFAKLAKQINFSHLPDDAKADFARLRPSKIDGKLKFSVKRGNSKPLASCPLLNPKVNQALAVLANTLDKFPIFDERTGRGLLRDVALLHDNGKISVVVVSAPITSDGFETELMNMHSLRGDLFSSIFIVPNGSECANINDACDLTSGRLISGELNKKIFDSRISSVNSVEDSALNFLGELIIQSAETLVVNCSPHHALRRKFPDLAFLNDATDSFHAGDNQSFADIKGKSCDILPPPMATVDRVVVAGKFSEGMRKWCVERGIREILHFTNDLNKVEWDALKLREHYSLSSVEVLATRPHSLDGFVVSRLTRL